jgi:hypothetical protein
MLSFSGDFCKGLVMTEMVRFWPDSGLAELAAPRGKSPARGGDLKIYHYRLWFFA